MLVKFQKWDI